MFEGLKTASSTSMAVVFTLTPLLAGFFDLIFSNRVMSKKVWITVVVAAIGALWIIFDGNIQNFINHLLCFYDFREVVRRRKTKNGLRS